MPSHPSSSRGRHWAGWLAVASSTGIASLWAFWGTIESFHEGWYRASLWQNIQLSVVHYLPWMFLPMVAALIALWRRWAGAIVHAGMAFAAASLFGFRWSAGTVLIAAPLLVLGVLHAIGSPTPIRWARRTLVVVPLFTAFVSGLVPGWRAITRPDAVDLSSTRLTVPAVDLWWAPAGPGWSETGFSWLEARRRCEYLLPDGTALAATPQHVWRLPTVDEAVRSMIWRGQNAGGAWNAATGQTSYRHAPDKEAPLWNPRSQVIYWWTADEVDEKRAYRVVYNGGVQAVLKSWAPGYLACRCVRDARPGPQAAPGVLALQPYFRDLRTVDVRAGDLRLTLLFDTGGGTTLVTPAVAVRLGCRPYGRDVGHRMSGERVEFARCDRLGLDGGSWRTVVAPIGVFDVNALLPPELPRIDGVLALDAFRNHVVTIDWPANRLTVHAPSEEDAASASHGVPLRVATGDSGRFFSVLLPVKATRGDVWFLLDSGDLRGTLVSERVLRDGLLPVEQDGLLSLTIGEHETWRTTAIPDDLVIDGTLGTAFLQRGPIALDLRVADGR